MLSTATTPHTLESLKHDIETHSLAPCRTDSSFMVLVCEQHKPNGECVVLQGHSVLPVVHRMI